MKNNYTQTSKLYCRTKVGANGATIIDSMFFTPPLKLFAPIYENDMAQLMLLNVSAGFMAGDTQEIEFDIGESCKVQILSQSYEKIHKMRSGSAVRNATLRVGNAAHLVYSPLPCIPFAHSSFAATTTIYLQEDSRLYYAEIFCAGRVGCGEIFAFHAYTQKLQIYKNDSLLYYDMMKLRPDSMRLDSLCMFHNYTHYLHCVLHDSAINYEYLESVVQQAQVFAAISTHNDFIIIKALANESESLLQFLKTLGIQAI